MINGNMKIVNINRMHDIVIVDTQPKSLIHDTVVVDTHPIYHIG